MKMVADSNGLIDLKITDSGLATEETLETAVIVSLLTDRRANTDDALPDGRASSGLIPPDRRGWAGDALSDVDGDRIGSRLWLLSREKQTEQTRLRAIDYAEEALQWLIDDGHAVSVSIEAEWSERGRLDMEIDIGLASGGRFRTSVEGVTGGAHAV